MFRSGYEDTLQIPYLTDPPSISLVKDLNFCIYQGPYVEIPEQGKVMPEMIMELLGDNVA
jgi:hypothetical protein